MTLRLQNKNTSQRAAIRTAPVSKGGTFIWGKGNYYFLISTKMCIKPHPLATTLS